jgi:predicted ATPase
VSVRLQLKNVGPISNGAFDLSKMTVFIGPNNAGKSVAAICAYAASLPAEWGTLFDTGLAQDRPQPERSLLRLPHHALDEEQWKPLAKAIMDAIESVPDEDSIDRLRVPGILLQYAEQRIESSLTTYGMRVADELERCFGTRLQDIARRRAEGNSEVVIRSSWPWTVRINLRGKPRVKVLRRPAPRRILVPALMRLVKRRETDSIWFEPDRHQFLVSDIAWDIAHDLLRPEFPAATKYLPAERAGLLQAHRVIVGAVLRRAPYAGIERIPDMPQMSGVITDFLAKILLAQAEPPESVYAAAASHLEERVMGGQVNIRETDQGHPEIAFRQGKDIFPLHRVSSMVTEVAPVVLFLRNFLQPNDLLVIEEPESHLHPQNQMRMANAITQLFAADLRLLITTHSDYFLGVLSNAVRLAQLDSGGSDKQMQPMSSGDVTAYAFSSTRRGGSTINRLEVSPVDGIDEEEFGRVADLLYDTSARLREEQIRGEQ